MIPMTTSVSQFATNVVLRDKNTAWSSLRCGSPDTQHMLFWYNCLGKEMQEHANYCRAKWTYVMFRVHQQKLSKTSDQGAQSSKESLVNLIRVWLLLTP